jgi:chemotaxis protein CheC
MKDKLTEINERAALDASRALSKLIDTPVSVVINKSETRKVEALDPIISLEEIVTGVYLPITGDIKGASLLIFPKETAFTLCDLLVKRVPGTTRKLTKLDESALKEVGNIISGNYFSTLSNLLQVKIVGHIPSFSFDMFGAVVGQIIAYFAQETKNALVIEMEFVFKPVTLTGYFLLLFKPEEINAVLSGVKEASLSK